MRQWIAVLDMEGVVTPEIWIAVAEATGVEGLRLTTRDIADYDELMRHRLRLLQKHSISLSQIQGIIRTLQPLDGAAAFLDALRAQVPVILLSDTFEQFAQPLLEKLHWPTLFCHRLIVQDNQIVDYQLRIPDQKRRTVEALRNLNFAVIAVGDSYNDLTMLRAADAGVLFRPPENVRKAAPEFPSVETHTQLLEEILRQIQSSKLEETSST